MLLTLTLLDSASHSGSLHIPAFPVVYQNGELQIEHWRMLSNSICADPYSKTTWKQWQVKRHFTSRKKKKSNCKVFLWQNGLACETTKWHWTVYLRGFPGGSDGKESPALQETQIQSLGGEDPLERGMATHSSILAWRIPRTEEPGGLPKEVYLKRILYKKLH